MNRSYSSRLPRVRYLSFPFRISENGGEVSARAAHIREQIEQVIFTSPGERVFRPEFGFGARQHVFENNAIPLWETIRTRLHSSLAEALAGEVDPKSLQVDVGAPPGQEAKLLVSISYQLAALQKEERHEFTV